LPPDPSATAPAVPRVVKGLSLVSLLNDFASEMVYPLLPGFIVTTLGGSATTLAAVDGAADCAAAATKWVSGGLSDRRGWRKPLIAVGYFIAILGRPVIALASAGWQVVGLRVVDRIGKGLRTPGRDALIADVTPPALRGRAFGLHRMADHFGSIPGALLAWWLLSQAVDVRTILGLSAVPGVLAGIVLLLVLRRAPDHSAGKADLDPGADATGRVFWGPVLALAALVLLRLPETLLLLRLQDLGVAMAVIPLVWAGLHVVRTVVSYPGGWLADRFGSRGLVALGGAAFAAGALGLALAADPATAVTIFLALGVVAGLMEPAERSLVTRLAPRRTGRGFGAYHAVTGLVALPAALGFGMAYQQLGGDVALRLSAGGMTVAALGWLVVTYRHQFAR